MFDFPGGIDILHALDARLIVQAGNIFIDTLFKGSGLHKGVNINGHEQVACIYRPAEIIQLFNRVAISSSGKHAGEQVNQHGQGIPFNPSHGHKAALQRCLRIGGRIAFSIKGPAWRQRLTLIGIEPNFAARGNRTGHVHHHVRAVPAGNGNGHGVGSQQRPFTPKGSHGGTGIGNNDADHIFFHRLHGKVSGNSKMVAIAHSNHAGAGLRSQVNGLFHGLDRDDLPQTVISVHERDSIIFHLNLNFRTGIDQSRLDALKINRHARNTVGTDSP